MRRASVSWFHARRWSAIVAACAAAFVILVSRLHALDFASGADVSWLPQMEASGVKYKDAKGVQGDLLTILHGMGFNAIRIRTWVNPSTSSCNGHCSQAEAIALAVRVKNAGMRVMIDFHYGDTWNDEGTQNPPAAWASLSYADTKTALYNYTYNFCVALNNAGVTPEWVSTGNEENSGICLPVGSASNPAQMTGLIMQGYTAIKAVFPSCSVVIHVASPQHSSATAMLDAYRANGGQWDITGFSSYASGSSVPGVQATAAGWVSRYGKPVMQVEVGGQASDISGTQSTCQTCINSLKTLGTDGRGVFYWEPETNLCSYGMSAWNSTSQQATAALSPFQNAATPLTPIVPTNLTAVSGNPQVALSWSASASSANYNVKRATVSGGPYTTITNTTATSYSDAAVTNGTTYYYVVTGNNSIGESANSTETNATPLAQPTYVVWQGDGVNNVWSANSNTNWANGSASSTYVTGYNVTFDDTGSASPAISLSGALQPGSVTVNATKNYTFGGSGSLAGVMGLTKVGTGTLTLNNANTYTGPTTLNAGVLQLANSLALQNSTLGGNGGGTLAFSGITAATLGGLTGAQSLVLANTAAAPVALSVGNNNASTTFAGSLTGSGSLTKTGTGTLTLTGNSLYTGSTSVSTGALELPANGALSSGPLYGAGYLIDGGSLTSSGATSFAALNNAFLESSGIVSLASVTSAASDGFLIKITGGSFTAASLTLQRTAAMTTAPTATAPIAASTTSGFYLNGATASVALGTVTVGNSNSSASARVDAGSLTVTGKLLLGHVTGGRWNILQVAGGSLTSTDPVDGIVCSPNNGTSGNDSELYLSGGTLTAEKIAFGTASDTAAGSSFLIVAGGSLYLGTGGIVQANTAGLTSTISLSTGTLGAKADWSSTLPMQLTGTGFTVKAANVSGTAHDIALGGILSGTGSLTKTGNGTLTLSANNTYTGATSISAGTLLLNGSLTGTAVTVQSGGTLGGTGLITGNVAVNSGGTLATGSSSFTIQGNLTNNGVVRFTGGATPQITGTFTNNGVLDIMTGAQTLPGNFVNHGVVLSAGMIQTQAITLNGTAVNLTIQSYTGHNYQLQRSNNLINPSWQNVGSAQTGSTGTSLTFTDASGLNAAGGFYRIVVFP